MGYFYVQRDEEYTVNEHGHIGRPAIKMPPSGQWVVRGAVRFNNFGRQVEFVPFPECFMRGLQWRHKNGKGRFFIADVDHGTNRVQMTPVRGAGPT